MKTKNEALLKKLILQSFLGGNREKFLKIRFDQEKYKEFQLDLIKRINFSKKETILDIGFGMGGLITALAIKKHKLIGIEPNDKYIQITKLRLSRYKIEHYPKLFKSTAEKMPFKNNSFSQVTCFDVIEHSSDPKKIFAELNRIMKDNGKAIITVPNRLAFIDPHFNLIGINYMPRKISQLILNTKKYSKDNYAGNQNLINMHYYIYPDLLKLIRTHNFSCTDMIEEKLKLNMTTKFLYSIWRLLFSDVFIISLTKKNNEKN